MINIVDKHNCCGCEACVQCCPKQCISMHEDQEGFLYPEVDITECIDCGLCEKVCPELNLLPEKQPIKVLGAKFKDKDIVLKSSSGGIFSYLANKVLDEGGVVFGARFDNEWNVIHDFTETKEGLIPFRKSKYVQSRIGDSFNKAKVFLKQGRKVLFTGTPCQIKALKLFLRKDYENLLAVDIACHSVPSPKVWRLYLNQIIKDNNITLSDIKAIDFRDKRNGWDKYNFTIKIRDGKDFTDSIRSNPYMKAFMSHLSTRLSCEKCDIKACKSNSDLTLGDFWGVNIIYPDFYDNNGVSIILVNSPKGEKFIGLNDLDLIETNLEEPLKYNGGIKAYTKVNKKHDIYLKGLSHRTNFIKYTNKYTKLSFKDRLKSKLYMIYNSLKKI